MRLPMHYTSVPNILKVLNPLFLDELRTQLNEASDNKIKLLNLRRRMARIRVFDPACGSGNFLVIAYKQMREIEAEINRRRSETHLASEIPLPENLRRAHETNDEVLERIYIGRRFKNDTERLEKLFDLYTKMTAATAKTKPATKATRGKRT